jgi:hypothetical protein
MIKRMGLYQDQTDSLSELKRLAALVMDPSRRDDIGPSQWPLAMIAYGLVTCNDADRLEESLEIYSQFRKFVTDEKRMTCVHQLAQFVRQRQGNGWRSLVPFALADPNPVIRRNAAFLVITLAEPTDADRFPGATLLSDLVVKTPEGVLDTTPVIDALLSLADLRFSDYANKIRTGLNREQLAQHLTALDATPTILTCNWLLDVLGDHPDLADDVTSALVRIAPKADEVMDVIVPIPSWKFKGDKVQSLHGWTRPEYFALMIGRLGSLTPEQTERVKLAWS